MNRKKKDFLIEYGGVFSCLAFCSTAYSGKKLATSEVTALYSGDSRKI